MDFIKFATPILAVLGIIALIVAGGFSVFGLFNKENKQKKADQDKIDDRLIYLLKEQVTQLEKKVADQAKQLQDNTLRLEALITENQTLRNVLQGRDDGMIEFRKKSLEITTSVYDLVKATNTSIDKLTNTLDKHFKT